MPLPDDYLDQPYVSPLVVDVSNYSRRITPEQVQALYNQGVRVAIIGALTGVDGTSYAREQVEVFQAAGIQTDGYFWLSRNHPEYFGDGLDLLDGYALNTAWVDAEDAHSGDTEDHTAILIRSALTLAETRFGHAGLYSSLGWLMANFAGQRLDGVPFWLANYDGVPVADPARTIGGMDLVAKQYAGDQHVAGVLCDLSVLTEAEARRRGLWPAA